MIASALSNGSGRPEIIVEGTILTFRPHGAATAAVAPEHVRAIRDAVHELWQDHDRIGLHYDTSGLIEVEHGYAEAMGELGQELGDGRVVYVVTVNRSWLRVLARTAALLGGIRVKFCRQPSQAVTYLRERGLGRRA